MSRSGWRGSFVLLALLAGTTLRAQDATVELRDQATVQGETIRLSDLLSPDATHATRLAAESISLGRAPEPGSVRVLRGEDLRRAVDGTIAVKFPGLAVVQGAGWPLRDSNLRQALRESEAGRRYDFSRARLVPPKDFSTRTSDPWLEVLGVSAATDTRNLSARLRCRQRSDCGSFLVEVVFDGAIVTRAVGQEASVLARSRAGRGGADRTVVALVQPGRPASLMFEGEGFRITKRVFPLQRAGFGQMVKVFDPTARHVALARVEGKDAVSFREAR